jgi:hypothetical protein
MEAFRRYFLQNAVLNLTDNIFLSCGKCRKFYLGVVTTSVLLILNTTELE